MKYTIYLTNDSDMGCPNQASQQLDAHAIQLYLQQSPQNAVVFEHADGRQTAFFQGADYSFNTWYYQDLPLEEPDAEQIADKLPDALDTMIQECGL